MTRIAGLYTRGQVLEGPEALALHDGLLAAGFKVVLRSASSYVQGETEAFDWVAVIGQRSAEGQITRDYRARGIPSIILDLGYINRASGERQGGDWTYQLSLDRLGWLPPDPMPDDRREKAKIEVPTFRGKQWQSPIVVCGQVEGDAGHGKQARDLHTIYRKWISFYRGTGRHVLFRPHPLSSEITGGYGEDGTASGPIHDVVSYAGAVISWNSNSGLDALLAGTPAICAADCIYYDMASRPCDPTGFPYPSRARMALFLNRLAYAQWTLAEIASGEAIRFIVQQRND